MPDKRQDPVFLTGDSRSGTTFLANLLIRHQQIGLAPESNFVIRLFRSSGAQSIATPSSLTQTLELIFRERKFQDWHLDHDRLHALLEPRLPLSKADLVRTVIQSYCDREFPDCTVWGLKKGGRYALDGPQLVEHFPSAKFIHLVRDGRAVFNSKKKAIHSGTGKPFETNPTRAAEAWCEFVESFDGFAGRYPDNAIEIRYEKMIDSLDEVLQSIFDFLRVPSNISIASEARLPIEPAYVAERSRHLHPNVGQPPLPKRIDAWRQELSSKEVRAFEMVAADQLRRKGYSVINDDEALRPTIAYRLRRNAKRLHRLLMQG